MARMWSLEEIDACYRRSLDRFLEGDELAARQEIPEFVEKYRMSKVKDAIASWILDGDSPARNILDAGCGHGWYPLRLLEKWGVAGRLFCADVSSHNIAMFNAEMARRTPGGRVFAIVADCERLPFGDEFFDIVYSTESLEHMESPERFFSEAARVLKSGGSLIITTPSGPMHRFWRFCFLPFARLKALVAGVRRDDDIQLGTKVYERTLSKREILKASAGTRLRISEYRKSVFLPHESYLRFFPHFALRIMLFIARTLETMGPLTNWAALHHVMRLVKL